MKSPFNILILIPHGGYRVPSELAEYVLINEFELFINADSCANELFAFNGVHTIINTDISRLFIDVDRDHTEVPPEHLDGVIKIYTNNEKHIYQDKTFPDEMAITNIFKRYYSPFHEYILRTLRTEDIKLIIECHTVNSVGPAMARDAGKVRPIIELEYKVYNKNDVVGTCSDTHIIGLLDNLRKTFKSEKEHGEVITLNQNASESYLLTRYGCGSVPMIKLSLSKSLFLDAEYFSLEQLSVASDRIDNLKQKLWKGIELFYKKFVQ